ncbi:MarR family transcriptional regulator [Nisaea acidiphila]|uniref:MarR family transcriptional regulator n=1 Tax=Nisaea acidiphila TaxID=1862145 RepID=A0A9J7AXQ9_9PROT|nr:MarR family transcriptional regulator [Nisaea acidiphila]UUX52072.1 MarR family transcriptional regulator [Nisaea acidiphila]
MSQDPNPKTRGQASQGAPLGSILEQWKRERPDLDPEPMAVCGALRRANDRVRTAIEGNVAASGLDGPGFDVLLTLRRQGRGETLTPSELAGEMMLSTSAMTNRLDRLEKRGLIERKADPSDRRSLRVALTEDGFALADELVVGHLAVEEDLLAPLSGAERVELIRLLEKIGA